MTRVWMYDEAERGRRFRRWGSLPRWRWLARRRAWRRFQEGQETRELEQASYLPFKRCGILDAHSRHEWSVAAVDGDTYECPGVRVEQVS